MDAPAATPVVMREEPRQTVLLELDRIDLGQRLRTINGGTVQHLAESMKIHGLQYPIQVRMDGDRYALVSGAHRLMAARHLAWPHIEAFVLDLLDDDTLALLEIDENLMRAELNPLDRGVFLARRKEIYERLYPETRRGGDRRSSAYQGQNDDGSHRGFVAETASFTPFSPWTIRRALRIGEKIAPELREEIAMTAIAYREGDLFTISGMDNEEQDRLLEDLQSAEQEVRALSDVHPRREPADGPDDNPEPAPEPAPAPASDADPSAEKTTLERLQTLWIAASEDEQAEFMAWLERMTGQGDPEQPVAS